MRVKNELGIEKTPDVLINGLHAFFKDVGLKSSYMSEEDIEKE